MRVLLIGSGGREHAIAWRLQQSPSVTMLFCAPGNPGIGRVARLVPLSVDAIDDLVAFALREKIDLTVVGPEYPLSVGIVDAFRAAGLVIFGPTRAAALLESSKAFAKEVMIASGVRTARHDVVSSLSEAERVVGDFGVPVVLKADGLASGKGVFVCFDEASVGRAIGELFAASGPHRVVVEEFLPGVEVSYIVATDGERIVPMAATHDYKRIFEHDEGPNTGGMGSVCPTPRLSDVEGHAVIDTVIRPVLRTMAERGAPFSGFLYAGLMKSPTGDCAVLEFNTRLGDPETQSIMACMRGDFARLLFELAAGSDEDPGRCISWIPGSAVTVVLAAEGYPATPVTGDAIHGENLLTSMPDVVAFHAGTSLRDDSLITAGGRVMAITGIGVDRESARVNAYRGVDMVQFRGRQVRRDIGQADTLSPRREGTQR